MAVLLLPAILAGQQQQQQQQKPQVPPVQYETRVDLILVDVNVVDAKGKPVEGLGAADFKVSVNGRPRHIASVQFVQQTAAAAAESPEPAAAARVSSNQDTARGRLFMLVVDEGNLLPADARALRDAVAKFFTALGPRDRVALATIPAGGPRVPFTADATRVTAALEQITGLGSQMSLSQYNIGLSEAIQLDNGRMSGWGEVVARECAGKSGLDLTICQQDVESDARAMAIDARQRADAALGGLLGVIQGLRAVDGPKTLVLASGGIVLEGQDAMSLSVATEASAANTSIYVLHLERPLVDVRSGRPSPTLSEDQALGRQGLELVSGRARGDTFNVATSGEFALARIATETSGYYLLGVDAEPDDRDGKAHQVNVQLVSPARGLTLRSRREFRFDAAAGGATDEERLGTVLSSPATVGEIPIRAATYTLAGTAPGKVQVMVAAEIDAGATAPQPAVVGFQLLDQSGRDRATVAQRLTLQPLRDDVPSPLRYVGNTLVDPGDYTLKLAVVEPDGRRGSIEHPVTARLTEAGPLQFGDLFVLDAPSVRSIDLRPEVETRLTGKRVALYCEIYGPDEHAFEGTSVTVEVAASDDGPALIGGKARAAGSDPTRRTVQAAMTTDALPPGEYVARVVVTRGDQPAARLARSFRIDPPAGTSAAAGAAAAPGNRLLDGFVPMPLFRREEVLAANILTPFLDQLGAPSTALLQTALADARNGQFDALADLSVPAPLVAPDLATAFLRGIGLLAKGELDPAAVQFRAALRASVDFFPAAFYLGACYAAGGRDTEAIGAWQTSLITQDDLPIVYELIADAMLRRGRYQEAKGVLEEAALRFPDDSRLAPRRAATALALGDAFGAYTLLDQYLERQRDDVDALFLMIRLFYEAASSQRWIANREDDLRKLTEYGRRYAEAGGPSRALVDQWIKSVSK